MKKHTQQTKEEKQSDVTRDFVQKLQDGIKRLKKITRGGILMELSTKQYLGGGA